MLVTNKQPCFEVLLQFCFEIKFQFHFDLCPSKSNYMKIAVIGSRNFTDQLVLENELNVIKDKVDLIISGGANGADNLAEKWALVNNIPTEVIKPDWKTYGRAAGIVRNKQIIESCDYCIAFWGTKSKGTLFSINYCKKLVKPFKIINFIPVETNLK